TVPRTLPEFVAAIWMSRCDGSVPGPILKNPLPVLSCTLQVLLPKLSAKAGSGKSSSNVSRPPEKRAVGPRSRKASCSASDCQAPPSDSVARSRVVSQAAPRFRQVLVQAPARCGSRTVLGNCGKSVEPRYGAVAQSQFTALRSARCHG